MFGDKFDIWDFYDVVLGLGLILLNVFEVNVQQWISEQQ